MKSRTLNTLGLVLGIVGVLIIFIWGPPQPSFDLGVAIGAENSDQHDREVLRAKGIYSVMSRVGLVTVMLGFGCQLLALWLPAEAGTAKQSERKQTPSAEDHR